MWPRIQLGHIPYSLVWPHGSPTSDAGGLESRFGAVLEPSAVCNLGRSQLLAQVSSSTLRHPSLNGLSFLA